MSDETFWLEEVDSETNPNVERMQRIKDLSKKEAEWDILNKKAARKGEVIACFVCYRKRFFANKEAGDGTWQDYRFTDLITTIPIKESLLTASGRRRMTIVGIRTEYNCFNNPFHKRTIDLDYEEEEFQASEILRKKTEEKREKKIQKELKGGRK